MPKRRISTSGVYLKDIIHVTPSILNSYQSLEEQTPGWNGDPFMTPEKFKAQMLGPKEFSEAALAGVAVHAACFGGEVLEDEGNFIVDAAVIEEVLRVSRFDPNTEIPEVSFMMNFPEFSARLSGRCDVLGDTRTIEAKTTKGKWTEARPDLEKYRRLPQSMAYATYFKVPCEIHVVHIKTSKPRSRPKGSLGLVSLAEGPGSPVSVAVVDPSESVKKMLDEWMAKTVDYISKDEEMLLHCLKKGQREQPVF